MYDFNIEPLIAKRAKLRYPYRELAALSGISHVVIQQTFVGKVGPSVRVILALCNALDVSPRVLFSKKQEAEVVS